MSETLDWNSYNKNERKCLVSKSMKISNGESLPDELWIKILEIGIEISILGCSDICSFSSCCKHFNKLSNDNTLWSLLLTLDYPQYKSLLHQSYSYYNKRLYIRVMFAWIQDKLAEDENRLSSLTRKMRRIRFQMEILDMILNDEHSTSDLALFKERYHVYREKLDKLEDEHMDIEEVYLRLLAKYAKYNGGSLAISPKGLATDVLEDDTGASSNEDSEDSLGYESEESLEESSENGSEESSKDETEENSEDESGESSDDGSEESSEDGPD